MANGFKKLAEGVKRQASLLSIGSRKTRAKKAKTGEKEADERRSEDAEGDPNASDAGDEREAEAPSVRPSRTPSIEEVIDEDDDIQMVEPRSQAEEDDLLVSE